MDYDLPKTAIVTYPKPPAEYRSELRAQSCENNELGDTGTIPQAFDLGAYHVSTGTSGTSITASGVNNTNYMYSIPIDKPVLEDQTNLQIEASNLEEAEELSSSANS